MSVPDEDRTRPPELRGPDLPFEEAASLLERWRHPRPHRWLRHAIDEGRVPAEGERVRTADLWRELLRDECDKLHNQAWCALERIREAEDPESVMMLAIDDLPSAVEQAYSLAPSLAEETLDLLRQHRRERYEDLVRELGVGTVREEAERAECLDFWVENAEGISEIRRTLFRIVRDALVGLANRES